MFSIFFVVLFVFFVGAGASVVRAGIMGVISLFALWFGRQYYVFIALFLSAFLMNLWNPKIILYDVGFQLSFLATFGIVLFSESFKSFFKWLPSFFAIRESFSMTLSAQVFVLPIILFNFGSLSLISPVANIFVLPLVPIAMFFGFLSVFFNFFFLGFSHFFAFFGYVVLNLIIFLIESFSSFEFASFSFEFEWYFVFLYYFLLLFFLRSSLKFHI
jgi:competence protein ComEC